MANEMDRTREDEGASPEAAGRRHLFFLGSLPKMAWPENSVVERLLTPPVRRLLG